MPSDPVACPGLSADRDFVRCVRLRATLRAEVCALRHCARYASGRRRGRGRFLPCSGCPVGGSVAERLARAGWAPPPDTAPAEVLDPSQRLARARWIRTYPRHAEPRLDEEPGSFAEIACPDVRAAIGRR